MTQKLNTPWIESPFFEKLLEESNLDDFQKNQARFYNENGYLIIKNAISKEMAQKVVDELQNEFPAKQGQEPLRHQDLWIKYESVKNVVIHQPILDTLKRLYGRESVPFQSLNFKFGTQQRAHSDSIHFSCLPARFMCGVWVALEPTDSQNGPLFYYPKSHKLQEYNYYDIGIKAHDNAMHYQEYETFMENLMATYGFQREELYIEQGDALVWSSNIIHGGTPIKTEGRTRWSQVTHYYFEDCIYYTPMHSDMLTHELFLRNIRNIRNGQVIQNKANNEAIEAIKTTEKTYIISNNISVGKVIYNKGIQTLKTIYKAIKGK
jgi:ectoine hydroxylase-related dioxygenase (phytanoyl-CoA dioxygenase family)